MKQQIDSLKGQLGQQEAALKAAAQEKSAVESKVQQLVIEKEFGAQNERMMASMQDEIANLRVLLSEKEKEVAKISAEAQEAKRKEGAFWKKKTRGNAKAIDELIQKTQEKLDSISLENLTLKSENEKRVFEIQSLKKELEFLSSQKGSLEGEVKEFKNRCRDLEEELKASKSDNERQHREYETLSNRYKTAKSETKDFKREVDLVITS